MPIINLLIKSRIQRLINGLSITQIKVNDELNISGKDIWESEHIKWIHILSSSWKVVVLLQVDRKKYLICLDKHILVRRKLFTIL